MVRLLFLVSLNHVKHETINQIKIVDIRHWLLYSSVQPQNGSHQGGIAGWLDAGNRPQFVYGEITGYYLSSLSFMAQQDDAVPQVITRMRSAIEWLRFQFKSCSAPATRYYLKSNGNKNEDWRNRAIFSFDLAMILRGLFEVGAALGASECANIAAQIHDLLSCLIDNDGFRSHIPRSNAMDVPITWSTQPGSYQVKTAAAILLAKAPTKLRDAAHATLRKEVGRVEPLCLAGELHPQFYYLEGLLLLALHELDRKAWSLTATVYSAIMEHQAADGSLPASLPDQGVASRSDVIAQALRVGCILKQAGYLTGGHWDIRLKRLANHLLCYCRRDGAVIFNLPKQSSGAHRNAWCAMFAHQAFSFYESLLRRRTIDQESLRLLF